MTALCSGKICTIFPEKGALNFWKACTIALEYSKGLYHLEIRFSDASVQIPVGGIQGFDGICSINYFSVTQSTAAKTFFSLHV